MYNHILIPIDGSKQAGFALDNAIDLAKALSAAPRLTIFHVNQQITFVEPTTGIALDRIQVEDEEAILSLAIIKLKEAGIEYDTVSAYGIPADEICHAAQERGVDLIVMGSRGKGHLSGMLLGSVSHAVAQHAYCPVLIVK